MVQISRKFSSRIQMFFSCPSQLSKIVFFEVMIMLLLLKKTDIFLSQKTTTKKFNELYKYARVPGSTKNSRMHKVFLTRDSNLSPQFNQGLKNERIFSTNLSPKFNQGLKNDSIFSTKESNQESLVQSKRQKCRYTLMVSCISRTQVSNLSPLLLNLRIQE